MDYQRVYYYFKGEREGTGRKREIESLLGFFKADVVNEVDAEHGCATPALETRVRWRGRSERKMTRTLNVYKSLNS
jgi:hypothetical protein